ncbi:MAG: phosphopantetheine-binding protein [Gammaproteobacteria bacterium]
MDRNLVKDVVMKHIKASTDMQDVDPSRSMKDYAISSLDIVEIVSMTMRELRVKVPRSDLMKIGTIDGLIDVVHHAAVTAPPR